MNDNLPPLPPYAPEFKPRWATDPGGYTAEQMQAYARAALASPQPHPVQKPVKGWWAHTCPEDGKVDVVNYQLTPADKRAGWVEHEVYTSQQAQPLTHLQAKALVEKYGNDPLHLIFQTEAAHGITKGTT